MRGLLAGTLVSADYASGELFDRLRVRVGDQRLEAVQRRLGTWWRGAVESLGPASPVRSIAERAAAPLFQILGYTARQFDLDAARRLARGVASAGRDARVGVLVVPWGDDLDTAWRDAVRQGMRVETRWCLCFNGTHLRIVDGDRCWTRRYVEFSLEVCANSREGAVLLSGLATAAALASRGGGRRGTGCPAACLLDEVADASARRAAAVCSSLHAGVTASVALLANAFARCSRSRAAAARSPDTVREEALTVVYRILFLLYAEARLLVPLWHPIYHASYSIEALRERIEREVAPRGLWESLQATARLARDGCRVGRLQVTAFNGQLFAGAPAPLAENCPVEDRVAREVLRHLTTTPGRSGARRRISYADLGVEQLGAVYEHLLDELPTLPRIAEAARGASPALARAEPVGGSRPAHAESLRKSTGTFYTPRSITDYLVRRALHPLVEGLRPEQILELRVLDPAMGSGAFLVAACRYLASAYEGALVRSGQARGGDIGEGDRARFRRAVAQSCLYGVDANPRAVQLARLSLWLATLAADSPLTFLDHRLRVGDSLVGADPADLARQPPGGRPRGGASILPLFDPDELLDAWRGSVPIRRQMAAVPDDSAQVVKWKESLIRRLQERRSSLGTWRRLADLWCAVWFWGDSPPPPGPRAYGELCAAIRGRACALPEPHRDGWLAEADRIASRATFFHWTLEFPEVFVRPDGQPREDGGFDAVLGNPPWDMVRAEARAAHTGDEARAAARRLVRFVREAGIYSGSHEAHVNRYQLFVERAVALLRRGGRLGMVVPWGLLSDHGSTAIRRRLLERTSIDALVSFENARAIFPIHRSVRFVLLTATGGAPSRTLRCRFGERDTVVLDKLPDDGGHGESFPVTLTARLLERVSGRPLAVPDLRHPDELSLLDHLVEAGPPLGSAEGWGARFSRDLNATDDRRHFTTRADDLAVVEGKHLSPFRVGTAGVRWRLPPAAADAVLPPGTPWRRRRLAYRVAASATNRLTLIAALLPAGTVSTHSVFCLRTPLEERTQWFLCGLLNSFVLNWLARLWVGTHVTAALVERLPAPRKTPDDPDFVAIERLARRLGSDDPQRRPDLAELQARVAALYRVTPDGLSRILGAFRLVEPRLRQEVIDAYGRVLAGAPAAPATSHDGART